MTCLALWLTMSVPIGAALPVEAWGADPAFRIEDAYKWIYQATQGGEHAAPSRDAAAAWLAREWASLGDALAEEPLIEPLGPWGAVRLNLRPYRARGGQQRPLVDAFLASAAEYTPNRARFLDVWSALGTHLRERPVGTLTFADWKRLDATMKPDGYPAIHHSEEYERARRPAYRVLTARRARELERLLER